MPSPVHAGCHIASLSQHPYSTHRRACAGTASLHGGGHREAGTLQSSFHPTPGPRGVAPLSGGVEGAVSTLHYPTPNPNQSPHRALLRVRTGRDREVRENRDETQSHVRVLELSLSKW